MSPRLPAALALLLAATLAFGQAKPPARPAAEADRILVDLRRLDLYNQILPVLIKPEQAKRLLAQVESAQEAEKRHLRDELVEMRKLDPTIADALKAARDKGEVPSREVITELIKAFRLLDAKRQVMVGEQTEKVLTAVEETLDAGQIKAAANALDPRIGNPGADPAKLSDRERLRAWVRVVLMDPLAYEILLELSKKPTRPPTDPKDDR